MRKMLTVTLKDQKTHNRQFTRILRNYYSNKYEDNINEDIKYLPESEIVRFINKYDLFVIYNGYRNSQRRIVQLIRATGKNIIFHESGHLPQAYMINDKYTLNIHIDYKGLYGESSLCDNLNWVKDEYVQEYKNFIENSFYKKYIEADKKEEYILSPLQLDWDSSLQYCGLTNIDLIRYVCKNYPKEKIIFKCHPRHKDKELKEIKNIINLHAGRGQNIEVVEDNYVGKNKENESKRIIKNDFLDLCLNAKAVIGLNSTSLIDALCLNKKVIAIAPCPIRTHMLSQKDFLKGEYKDIFLTGYFKSRYLCSSKEEAKDRLEILFKRAGWCF